MRIIENCEKCLYDKQKHRVSAMTDPAKREQYLLAVKEILKNRKEEDTSPFMIYQFQKSFEKLFGIGQDYRGIKKEYNDLVLSMESEIEKRIEHAKDPLKEALIYARTGNYIDFGAMNHVDKDTFLSLFDRNESLDQEVYEAFCEDCGKGKRFFLACDNCGEIVLDKLFIRQLKKKYQDMDVAVLVRGGEVLNDATVEDAEYAGISKEARVISNGLDFAGTQMNLLPEDVKQELLCADVILSKGQGNYETLSGCGLNVYYSFLCKCELFVTRFQTAPLTGMFVHEGHLPEMKIMTEKKGCCPSGGEF